MTQQIPGTGPEPVPPTLPARPLALVTSDDDALVNGLPRRLRSRHLSMIGLGGVIGAGLFVGSGAGVALAGPGILVSYLGAGALAMAVMRMLGEMVALYPANGSFSVHAEKALGRWAGFTLGWMYWVMLVVVLAIEATAAAAILHGWVHAVAPWVWVLALVTVFTLTNLAAVGTYGELEFWFALIKVVAIIGFVALGLAAVFGWLPDPSSASLSDTLSGHGGLLPRGWGGVLNGLLAVVFSFGGMELVTLAAAETGDPSRAIGRAVSSTAWRILLFYVGSITVVVMLLPWNSSGIGDSPYVAVLDRIGVRSAGQVMTVVVLVALLSALNANLYGASRLLHSLALRGEAPRQLARLSGRQVPRAAILCSVLVGYVSVLLNVFWPDSVFLYLADAIGGVVLAVWAMIACTQLRMRRLMAPGQAAASLTVRSWGYPYANWAVLAAIAVIVGLLLHQGGGVSLLCTLVLLAVLLAAALLREVLLRRRAEPDRSSDPGAGES
ncbi:amino acid permease [Streptomyces sp. NPDC048106]|uniref:amino acid permease n=1 Tax=Streptomyces sp. NPDC048106 TaxID=3155750 RepID=UPI003452F949